VTRIYLQTEMTDWNNVVATMETAHGAVLTDEEKATITEFLESRNPSEAEVVIQGKCTTAMTSAESTRSRPVPTGRASSIR